MLIRQCCYDFLDNSFFGRGNVVKDPLRRGAFQFLLSFLWLLITGYTYSSLVPLNRVRHLCHSLQTTGMWHWLMFSRVLPVHYPWLLTQYSWDISNILLEESFSTNIYIIHMCVCVCVFLSTFLQNPGQWLSKNMDCQTRQINRAMFR